MFRVFLLASSLLIFSLPSTAQNVYVWRDADGVMNYSDSPPVGGAVGEVRKLGVRTFTAVEGGGSAPSMSPSSDRSGQVSTIGSGQARDGLTSGGREISAGGTYGGGVMAGGSSGGGASSAGGSGTEGGATGRTAAGSSAPAPVSSAPAPVSSASAPGVAVPIATAPAPDAAVPISTAPAPDRAVPVSTAPAPDRAVPVSTTPVPDRALPVSTAPVPDRAVPVSTAPITATSSATTAPSAGSPATDGASGGSTGSQNAGGSSGGAQATLYWDEVTKPPISKIPVAGYRVYFGTAPGAYLQPRGQGVNAGNVTSYTVQGLTTGTRYYFTVTTYVGGSESPFANEVSKVAGP